jgi:hypothetical protein
MPSTPRMPKPPGTRMPSADLTVAQLEAYLSGSPACAASWATARRGKAGGRSGQPEPGQPTPLQASVGVRQAGDVDVLGTQRAPTLLTGVGVGGCGCAPQPPPRRAHLTSRLLASTHSSASLRLAAMHACCSDFMTDR